MNRALPAGFPTRRQLRRFIADAALRILDEAVVRGSRLYLERVEGLHVRWCLSTSSSIAGTARWLTLRPAARTLFSIGPGMPPPDSSLAGKAALITGAERGIGRAIASALLEAGAVVGITALPASEDRARLTARELDPSGLQARAYVLDVRSTESIAEALRRFITDYERLDVLVNNAGVRLVSSSLSMEEQAWDNVLAVNLRGVFFCAQQAASYMQSAGGAIVNVSSQLGLVASKDRAAYCASKAAVIHLTRALALDWAPYRIRVNAVAPGTTRTQDANVAGDPTAAVDLLVRTPLGRPIEPYEVAAAVHYLASPMATAVTGHTLVVDGGWTLS